MFQTRIIKKQLHFKQPAVHREEYIPPETYGIYSSPIPTTIIME